MNELPQMRPVFFIQAGNVALTDVGDVGFGHGLVPRVKYDVTC